MNTRPIIVSGALDDLRSRDVRFLEQASKLGEVTVVIWPDEMVESFTGQPPRFPLAERLYMLSALRYVNQTIAGDASGPNFGLPPKLRGGRGVWADTENKANESRSGFCRKHSLEYHVIPDHALEGFPDPPPISSTQARKKVVVTGCYDWLHSGHVRFFEQVSSYGDLYVVVGHDENIRSLKGEGHPLQSQQERRYMAGAIRHVKQALISTGAGWLDADPEIRRLKPDIYAVNDDGDRGGKREYCANLSIEYLVLKRTPAPGLQVRTSTELRGF